MNSQHDENVWKDVEGKPGIAVLEQRSSNVATNNPALREVIAKLQAIEEFQPQSRRHVDATRQVK